MTEIETIGNNNHSLIDETKIKVFVKELLNTFGSTEIIPDEKEIERFISKLRNKFKINVKKSQMRYVYEKYLLNDFPELNYVMSRYLIKKATRSRSGVLVSTITLKPDKFSCPKKCSYCPTETDLEGKPTQPKSYLSSEPAMLRALQYNFDVKGQLWDRIRSYIKTGNISNNSKNDENTSYKLEMILSGGTWESYSYLYRNQVMHEIYYAANTFGCEREMLPFDDELKINETAKYRIIGMTIETRPDFITNQSIKDYRRWGVTRVQIGVQHYDDEILKKLNRECTTSDTIKAIKLLKQTGFKVVCHLMPDLPGSSPFKDTLMFFQAINDTDVQFDDVKIYPTAVCKSNNPNLIVKSDIADWYDKGEYKPYAEKNIRDLIDVLKYYKKNIQPWVRIQRLVRDIPSTSIEAGYEKITNLRQIIQDELKTENIKCRCIRCMEIGNNNSLIENAKIVVRKYEASEGDEYFISIESNKKSKFYELDYWKYVLFLIKHYFMLCLFHKEPYWEGNLNTYNGIIGFCRLRIDPNIRSDMFKELTRCALIREVHVYGYSSSIGNTNKNILKSCQHKGFGQKLVLVAEEIALQNGYKKMAIIAGVGTREYYKNKCGYHLEGTYMIKHLTSSLPDYKLTIGLIAWVIILIDILFI